MNIRVLHKRRRLYLIAEPLFLASEEKICSSLIKVTDLLDEI
jgi:hypothetical protein